MFEHALPGWSRVNLTDLATYVNGYAFKPEDWSEHGLPIVRIAQITGSSADCDYYQGRLSEDVKIDNGDIIFSWSGTLCVVQWNGGPAWLNQHLFKVKPAEGVSHRLLYHILSHAVAEMDKSAHGSTMKHIKRSELKRYELLFPNSRKEQEKIGRVLDTLDTQIQKTEALIAKLEKVKAGLLHDLLTRGIDENGRLRPSPEQAPELYKESPLGLIPREWGVGSLGDLSEIVSGVTLGGKSGSSAWPLVPYLRVANVQDGYLDLTDIKLIRVSPADIEKYRLLPGDVLMNEGGDFDKLGRGALWQGQIDLCLHQNHVFRVRATPGVLSPHFLTAFSSSAAGKRYFIRSSKQSTNLASINSTQLKAFQVPLPSSGEQMLIVKELQAMASKTESEKDFLDKVITKKSGLMDDLLTGRVRVTPLLDQAQTQVTTPA